ncbi:carboxypeptidase-like regulatory domain-containing protein [Psychroserpens sp.]|uniref:carboxypeptidase-like regulatory domain-containing protein n=1 Tax=Psychroserpens sp. TaxID=2020870 RepID=UPI001B2029D2|nr:carboxypeptidase-like regulatory domain-containing protein [Psychroserpens sp.]MBO6605272.1 carboxypeptidase-like regulatory domain-containing protein [Psychroserpens sp.]MBO6653919.1 carboxypeptidase-like regulatory domain-containing protein [Psychroserpens sp.]MBO6682240.1 carboxypeptidase-like regulatory domain-containing protein [Psychroserpens sp.]MBO6748646.1 carboxypeptidase-like regulatory domain-containing protein [Psychroserpens sp.]MBO6915165.1 carboxypeptidase-like regulatory do
MKTIPRYYIIILLLFGINAITNAQNGKVKGILTSPEDGLPLPGVSVIIKGTTVGTQTDFDGEYSITCDVGDTLVFSFIGMQTREVIVTEQMFSIKNNNFKIDYFKVAIIKSDAYKKALESQSDLKLKIKSIDDGKDATYKNYYDVYRIKDFNFEKDSVNITYFDPDIFYEIRTSSMLGIQFVRNQNLPKLQSTFSQGASSSGVLSFQGPETGNIFSYGPRLDNLQFDGSNYPYDINGRPVPFGSGQGARLSAYDNSIIEPSVISSNTVNLSLSTDEKLLEFGYNNQSNRDLFNQERRSSNFFDIHFKSLNKYKTRTNWSGLVKYGKIIDRQPNINGFINNVLLNSWATPASFSNSQGYLLNGSQRRFSEQFNNPYWLLNTNRNNEENQSFLGSVKIKKWLNDKLSILGQVDFNHTNDGQRFAVPLHTAGFDTGFASEKDILRNDLRIAFHLNYEKWFNDLHFELNSVVHFNNELMKYRFDERRDFASIVFEDPQFSNTERQKLHRNSLTLSNSFMVDLHEPELEIKLTNNSYLSSIQNNKLFLPNLQLRLKVDHLLELYDFNHIDLTASTSMAINEPDLFYNNRSHNSLLITPMESLQFTSNNDLFLNNSIGLEELRTIEFGTSIGFSTHPFRFDFNASYYDRLTKNALYPILGNTTFVLDNVGDISNKGFELTFNTDISIDDHLKYSSRVVFSKYRTEVLKLNNEQSAIPIAGFATVSKQLIVGEQAGIIVGTAYERDGNNNLIIGDDGFPLVANTTQIIGDPVPDYNLGLDNTFNFKGFTLNVLLDIQKGGNVWNGTQNTLNYLGTSQQSASDRSITNFIYPGVTLQGDVNTVPVDFYAAENDISQNRFVRYGYSGVDEDAIEDGRYVNLRSINLSYNFKPDKKDAFFREVDIVIYANNLLTWTKFDGASPYSNLYDGPSAQGLNFFNLPMTTEIGFKLDIKL